MTTTKDSARSNLPMLQGKSAVVFGAGGSIGAAVAKEFAAEGAEVFLAGRTAQPIELIAEEIAAGDGMAHTRVVDAVDPDAVDQLMKSIVEQTGRVDVEFNAVGPRVVEYGNGKPAIELSVE